MYILVPCVRLTKVFPTCRVLNMEGALTSYQSFLVKGSMLKGTKNDKSERTQKMKNMIDLHLLLGTLLASLSESLVLTDSHFNTRVSISGAQTDQDPETENTHLNQNIRYRH